MTNSTGTETITISKQELRDAQARGEGFFFEASQSVPSAEAIAAMVGTCRHSETFRLEEDDPYTDAFAGDIQCIECAKVLHRA